MGDEDLITKQELYRTSVKCSSLEGSVACMRKEDFLRLENQTLCWQAIIGNAKQKQQTIVKRVYMK